MSKIRVLHKAPVLNDLGVILSVVELAGPSSESKPTTGIANGSLFRETDTGKIFIFDEDDGWSETGSGGGGGSGLPDTPGTDGTYSLQNTVESGTGTLSWAPGGSSGGALYVHSGVGDALDTTWQDIKDAFDGGRPVILAGATLEYLSSISYDDYGYYVTFFTQLGYSAYTAETANSYPVLQA